MDGLTQTAFRKTAGLFSQYNSVSLLPEGALVSAKNIAIDREGIISCRRGFEVYGVDLPAMGDDIFEYESTPIVRSGSRLYSDADGVGGTWNVWNEDGEYDLFSPPVGYRTEAVEARGCVFLTTENGIYRSDDPQGNPRPAGMPKALDLNVSFRHSQSAQGWIPPGNQVAYRIAWYRKDRRNTALIGSPSYRTVMVNPATVTGAAAVSSGGNVSVVTMTEHGLAVGDHVYVANSSDETVIENGWIPVISVPTVDSFTISNNGAVETTTATADLSTYPDIILNFTIPPGIKAGDSYRIYRSRLSGYEDVDPGDRLQYVRQAVVTAADIAGIFIETVDDYPDQPLGENLHSNDNQDGTDAQNDIPPYARFVCLYEGHVLYANIRRWHELRIRLTGSTNLGGQISLNCGERTYTYFLGASEDPASGLVKVSDTGVFAYDLRETAKSFVRVINRDPNQVSVVAWYASGPDDPAGIIQIRRRDYRDLPFHVTAQTAGQGAQFDPPLPTIGEEVKSANDAFANRVAIAKFEQPDSAPILNTLVFGEDNSPILGMIALKDAVIIATTGGYYIITGKTDGSMGRAFTREPLDPTLMIKGARTFVRLDNATYGNTKQGVVRAVSGSSSLVTRAIEPDLKALMALSNFDTVSFAVAHETDQRFILATPTLESDTYATQLWIYNYLTGAIARWEKNVRAGRTMRRDDRLYFLDASYPRVIRERRTFKTTDWDFQDEDEDITITGVGSTLDTNGATVRTLTFNYSGSETMGPGWYIEQGSIGSRAISISLLSGISYLAVLDTYPGFATGPATIFKPIDFSFSYHGMELGNAGVTKQFSTCQFYFESQRTRTHRMGFQSNASAEPEWIGEQRFPRARPKPIYYKWGQFPWGQRPWSQSYDSGLLPTTTQIPVLTAVPSSQQMGESLQVSYAHKVARESVEILQMAIDFRPIGTRTMRRTD